MGQSNRIPISVRISQEDIDFIADLQIGEATTPSEKIRELLKQARLHHEQEQDYQAVLHSCERTISGAKHQILHHEKALGVHSHILARVFELLPDLVATMAADYPQTADKSALIDYEKQVMWRIVRLMDSVLQLAVTARGAGYDDKVLSELNNTLQLAHIILSSKSKE